MGNAPTLTVEDKVLRLNNSAAITDFFSVDNNGGSAITMYRIEDLESGFETGFLRFNGGTIENGSRLEVTPDQLANLFYVAGAAVSKEGVRIQAYNGMAWSNATNISYAYSSVPNQTAPVVEASSGDPNVLADEYVLFDSLISAYDPDGHPILRYFIRDTKRDGKYFWLNGERKVETNSFYVEAEDIGNLRYYGRGSGIERATVLVYDGVDWSPRGDIDIRTIANVNRPTVQPRRSSFAANSSVSLSTLLDIFDADGNTIKKLLVRDTSPHSWTDSIQRNGESLAPQQWHEINFADIDEYTWTAADRLFEGTTRVRAYDGKHWSRITALTLTSIPRPEIDVDPFLIQSQLESTPLGSLISQDDRGPQITQYQWFDSNTSFGSGKLTRGTTDLQNGVVHTITSTDLDSHRMISGTYVSRGTDDFYVRAFNGTYWGGWERITLRTEPEYDDALNFGNGLSWATTLPFEWQQTRVIPYSFMTEAPADYDEWGEAEDATEFPNFTFAPFTTQQRESAFMAFEHFESIANVQFEQMPDSATNEYGQRGGLLRMMNYRYFPPDSFAAAYAFTPGIEPQNGDMFFNLAFLSSTDVFAGSSYWTTFLHELGHAMGQKHSFDGTPKLPAATENDNFTVMSYTGREDRLSPATYQLYDIWNLQNLYGANTTFRTEDNLYDINNFWDGQQDFVHAIWDAGGTDTLSGLNSFQAVNIDLAAGAHSSIGTAENNVAIAFGVIIENATGSIHNDTLVGNRFDNVLDGGAGNDLINGGSGNDTLAGGFGNDRYIWGVADGDDRIVEGATGGRDVLAIDHFSGETLDITSDFTVRRLGTDLIIELSLDGEPQSGSVTIVNQAWGRHQTETLELSGVRIDATDLYAKSTSVSQKFQLQPNESTFGFLVSPV